MDNDTNIDLRKLLASAALEDEKLAEELILAVGHKSSIWIPQERPRGSNKKNHLKIILNVSRNILKQFQINFQTLKGS